VQRTYGLLPDVKAGVGVPDEANEADEVVQTAQLAIPAKVEVPPTVVVFDVLEHE